MKKKRQWCWLAAFVFTLLMLGGCQKKYIGNSTDNNSTSCGNIVMGNGKFAICSDFVYFTNRNAIYEYDMETKKTIVLDSKSEDVRSIYVQDEYIYFACDGLKRITKDGKKVQHLFKRKAGCLQLYVEEEYAYFLEGIEGSLYRRNLRDDSETEILKNVLAYYVDKNNIYAIARENDISHMYVSKKDKIDFNVQELSFIPITVFAAGDAIYLSERQSYQIVKITSNGEERLPVYATYYQVINDRIIYLDSTTYENSCFTLAEYDMKTGESKSIYEEVFDFNVLENKYVCIQHMPAQSAEYFIYDLEAEESLLMYREGN